MTKRIILSLSIALGLTSQASAVTNMLVNPGFEDTNTDTFYGDDWGVFGAADFNAFFGANGHASLFADTAGNFGGVYQAQIPGTPGTTYQFDLLDTRIESGWDADLRIGLEYYAADDTTKLGETLATLDTATRISNGQNNGNVFSIQGTAVSGTAFVRPIVMYDNVNPAYAAQTQASTFVFDSYLSLAPGPGDQALKNPGFDDENGDGSLGDNWGSFGNTGFNDFFGGNKHASFFGDFVGNAGGIWQQSVLGTPGSEYQFDLLDVRVEANWDADLTFGLEFFGDDDFTKIGEVLTTADTSVTGDGLSFTMTATVAAGTKYIRPIIRFDNVNAGYIGQSQANLFVFSTSLSELVAGLDGDLDGDGFVGINDLNIVLGNWNQNVPPGDPLADPTGDGFVGIADLNIVLGNWNAGTPPTQGSAVPEPASMVLVSLLGGLALMRRQPNLHNASAHKSCAV
jgi:hypothetical protein